MSVLDVLDALPESGQGAADSRSTAGRGDAEIQSMNAEAPLLDLIRSDTGEEGHASGDRIDFKSCPVCGHSGCFSYYPTTNSWSCFSKSNTSGYEGGSYVEYQRAAHGMDATEAVRSLREATGMPPGA